MATLDENLKVWNDNYDWPNAGDEWSRDFGGTEAQWFFVLYPRLHQFIPSRTILEIAPGFGRWTQFLKSQCHSMIAVDISQKCIDYCKHRFASETHVEFRVNDGTSLDIVPDRSMDFVFSFDSLVHAEKEVMETYLLQLARKLTPDGVGFIHHSNMGAYPRRLMLWKLYNQLPGIFRGRILPKERVSTLLSINLQSGRAKSMTAALFREYCAQTGLKCIHQELMNWHIGKCLIDAISVFARPGSKWDNGYRLVENSEFVTSAALTSRLAELYCVTKSEKVLVE